MQTVSEATVPQSGSDAWEQLGDPSPVPVTPMATAAAPTPPPLCLKPQAGVYVMETKLLQPTKTFTVNIIIYKRCQTVKQTKNVKHCICYFHKVLLCISTCK